MAFTSLPINSVVLDVPALTASVANAVAYSGVQVDTLVAMTALTPSQVAVGSDVLVRQLSTRYTRIASVNMLPNSEFPNGLTDASTRAGLVTLTALSGYTNALAFGYDGSTLSYAYKAFVQTTGHQYTLSVIVEMADTLAPVPGGSGAGNDFSFVFENNTVSSGGYTVTSLGGGRYRVSVTRTTTVTGSRNFGIIKFAAHTARTFKVTAYQLEYGALTTYEPVIAPWLHVDARSTGGCLYEVQAKEGRVTPSMFGALTNVTDDSVVVNRAAAAAASKFWTLVIDQDLCLSAAVYLRFGIRGCIGTNNAIVKCLSVSGGFVVPWIGQVGTVFNSANVTVDGLTLNANGFATVTIWAGCVSFSRFTRNTIMNHPGTGGYGILLRSYLAGGAACAFNTIHENTYAGTIGPTGESGGVAIALDSELNLSGYAGGIELWKTTFTAPIPYYPPTKNHVTNNLIEGGYYGISLSGAQFNMVAVNTCRNNTRGISVQNNSSDNSILSNKIEENKSSAIHLAYGSSRNVVALNNETSARADGEGQFQAYVGSKNNTFHKNVTNITAGVGPSFHLYCGCHADGNKFTDNDLNGPAAKAHIGCESGWNTATADLASRASGNDVVVNNYSNTGMSGVAFIRNIVNGASIAAVFLGQTSDAGGNYALSNITVDGTIVTGDNHTQQLRLVENNSGSLSGLILTRNGFYPVASTKFGLPRGWSHFTKRVANDILDTMTMAFANLDTTPSVGIGATFQHVDSSATSVTMYDDGADDQSILVRLSANTTLVHNTSFLRLKGGADVVGSTAGGSNAFLTLRRTSGVWFEMSRNF